MQSRRRLGVWVVVLWVMSTIATAPNAVSRAAPKSQQCKPCQGGKTKCCNGFCMGQQSKDIFSSILLPNLAGHTKVDDGLSDLDARNTGNGAVELWTVSERGHRIYSISVSGKSGKPILKVKEHPVIGPDNKKYDFDGYSLEGIALLTEDASKIAISAEKNKNNETLSAIFSIERKVDGKFKFVSKLELLVDKKQEHPCEIDSIKIDDDAGPEGICGKDDTIFFAMESYQGQGSAKGAPKRWAPIYRMEKGEITNLYRLQLNDKENTKVSGLDCRFAKETNSVEFTAIERSFETTRFLKFEISLNLKKDKKSNCVENITNATKVLRENNIRDFLCRYPAAPSEACGPNLEGIAWSGNRLFTIADNQFGDNVDCPNELLEFAQKSLKLPLP